MNAQAFTEGVMNTDLYSIVDVKYDVQEVHDIPGKIDIAAIHNATCEKLTIATDNCNFIADGANLCVEKHVTHWWPYVACMYDFAGIAGDDSNPLAKADTFDVSMVQCLDHVTGYTAEELKKCVYGDEAASLRMASAKKTLAAMDAGFPDIVWAVVDDKFVPAPKFVPPASAAYKQQLEDWKKSLVSAICSAYEPHRPEDTPKQCQNSTAEGPTFI